MRSAHEWGRDELSVMSAFLAVADERSFTKAAKRMRVTQSALSHAIRGLEEQVGVRLLARTTRSVAPTEAGEQLLAELRPALTGIRGALDRIGGLRDTPRGRLRLLVPRLAALRVLGPKLAQFARNYPEVVLDVSTDETRLDLVASGFDAGVQVRRIHPERHGGGSCVAGSPASDCRVTGVLRGSSEADFSARPAPTSMRQLPAWFRRGLSLGAGQRRSVPGRRCERAADYERHRAPDAGGTRRRRSRVHVRRSSGSSPRKRGLGASARGLVSSVSWVLPVTTRAGNSRLRR